MKCDACGIQSGYIRESNMEWNTKGCFLCKHLQWFEADYESFESSGYFCDNRDDEPHLIFKTFPSKRVLKCRELPSSVGGE